MENSAALAALPVPGAIRAPLYPRAGAGGTTASQKGQAQTPVHTE